MAAETCVESMEWGAALDGERVHLFHLSNDFMQVKVATYGARITSVRTPDRHGVQGEVSLGSEEFAPYLTDCAYLGATIGRYGNRIAKGCFSLDGKTYHVPLGDGPNALHGGPLGFDKKIWVATVVDHGVQMTYLSPDGEMGFPGNLSVRVTYTLDDKTLGIKYEAVTDAATVVNLTNHAYWNLTGASDSVSGHNLRLYASSFAVPDPTMIPTGEIRSVAGTPLDFLASHCIGQGWDSAYLPVQFANGYDQSWLIDKGVTDGTGMQAVLAAEVFEPVSGRSLRVYTSEPAVHFYSGNFLDGTFPGRGGLIARRSGFCLETQHLPDAPNHPSFASTRLDAGDTYRSTTLHVFG